MRWVRAASTLRASTCPTVTVERILNDLSETGQSRHILSRPKLGIWLRQTFLTRGLSCLSQTDGPTNEGQPVHRCDGSEQTGRPKTSFGLLGPEVPAISVPPSRRVET